MTKGVSKSLTRSASGGGDGTIKLWPKDGAGEPVVRRHGRSQVSALAVLADGRLASGSALDGTIKLWPKDGAGEPVVLEHFGVTSLVGLADGRLASGGWNNTLKLWPKDGASEPVVLPHDNWVSSLAVLADG